MSYHYNFIMGGIIILGLYACTMICMQAGLIIIDSMILLITVCVRRGLLYSDVLCDALVQFGCYQHNIL